MGVLKLLSALFLLSLLRPGLSHVVEKFSSVPQCEDFFLEKTTPNIPDILVDGNVKGQNRYKPICQTFKNHYRFATLYDTTNRIPVFSAYKFTGDGGSRNDIEKQWKIEPQLEDINAGKSMSEDVNNIQYEHQARNQDYKNSNIVNRGHLFPCMHADGNDAKESTFTLTNIVPQVESFNGGSWKLMEENVKNIMKHSCKDDKKPIEAYVVTGAVPSKDTEEKLVNIPTLMWTAYCCKNPNTKQWHSGAHWGENAENAETNCLPVADLHSMLTKIYKGNVQVFPQECLKPTEVHFRSTLGSEHREC
uniref:Endonuclease domain-containing 1 protein n=1 Tax=Esox lucius TaxID=8010 RepID=A0AAY5L0B6_ESOLU